jgi:hypothetical protein
VLSQITVAISDDFCSFLQSAIQELFETGDIAASKRSSHTFKSPAEGEQAVRTEQS